MTWPFENDTSVAVKAFAVRSLKVNRKKNSLIVVAVLIITFLLTLVLSAGNIFASAQRTESLRLIGTTAETTLSNPTEGQKELLRRLMLAWNCILEL